MGKIVRQGVAYCGSSDSAENINYDNTKNVKEAIDELNGKLGWKLIGRITSIGTVYDCDFTKYNELFFVNSTSASTTRYHIHIITACLTDNKQVFVSYVAYQNSHSFSMEIDIRKTSANLLVFGGFSSGQLNDIINIYAK